MRRCIVLSFLALTSCRDELRVLEPIELPFNLQDVARIEAVSVHETNGDKFRRDRETFAADGMLLEPREVSRAQFPRLFGVITLLALQDDEALTLCLPVYRDYLDLYDVYGMHLMTMDICFGCGATVMTGPLGRTFHGGVGPREAHTLADIMASVGYTENLPDDYFTHAALAGASRLRPAGD